MEALKNVGVFNNKIVLLSPYRRAVPPGKRYQFCVRVGNYPNIKLAINSDFVYNTSDEARNAGERECMKKGFNPMKAQIFTIRRNKYNALNA